MTKEQLAKRLAEADDRLATLSVAAENTFRAYEEDRDVAGAIRRLGRIVGTLGNNSWGAGAIIEAGQEWAERYGAPPKVDDWNPKAAIDRGHPEQAERFYEGTWPHYALVRHHFKGWRPFMQACGFEPREGPDSFNDKGMDVSGLPVWTGWQYLAGHRARAGMTQGDLAVRAGVSRTHIGDLENGRHANPGVRVLLAICKAIGVPPAAIIE